MAKTRALIVDDSPTIRQLLAAKLEADSEIEVVGSAGDPHEARAAIKELNPDVITLDIEMPKMNGLEFLEKIMRLRPMPVVMVSTLTQEGADASIEALSLGAVDCVGKPDFDGIAEKVKVAASARIAPRTSNQAAAARRAEFRPNRNVIAIGSSTGGVEALLSVLGGFPENCPPTLVTQHMPANFTSSFSARLDRHCAPRVQEAQDGMPIEKGNIYVAPGGAAHLTAARADGPVCRLVASDLVNGHRPSVDILMKSVAEVFGARAAGAVLTGMGRDGAEGLKAIRSAGGRTFGQDEATSVVYGMPKAANELGAVEKQLPLEKISAAILKVCSIENEENR